MKKLLLSICSLGLIFSLAFPLTGCGSKKKQDEYKRDGIEAMQDKDYDRALKCFSGALAQSGRVGKDEQDIALYKASAQYKLGKKNAALKTLESLLKFNPEDYKALYLMGLIYCDDAKPDKAFTYLSKACSASGKSSLYENAYLSLINAGMTKQADSFYGKMPKEAKASKKVLKLRVICYENENDYSNALNCVKHYLKQYPDDEDMKKEQDFLKTVLRSVS